jgi:glucose/arabinose dehydrogenase
VNIANSPREGLKRLFMLPGAHFSSPEMAWKFEVAPGGIAFAGRGLGDRYEGDLFMGGARDLLQGGHLFRFNLTRDRRRIDVSDRRLLDRVADNRRKWEITESETLLIGRNFGVVPDIVSGPNGNLFVVSLSKGTIYEISRRK